MLLYMLYTHSMAPTLFVPARTSSAMSMHHEPLARMKSSIKTRIKTYDS